MVIIQLSLLCDSAMFFSYCQLSFYVNFNDEKGIEKTHPLIVLPFVMMNCIFLTNP